MQLTKIALAISLLCCAKAGFGADISFTGNFTQDDNVQLFQFTVGASSDVTLRTWSYAGGVNAAGQTIAEGGFDPILAVFDSTGALIGQNDDGGCGLVAHDSRTNQCWDTYFTASLAPGTYTTSVMEYYNFANGPNLSDGFSQDGTGNFTAGASGCPASSFCDVSGDARDNHWAFDILNVDSASTTPEPGSLVLLGLGAAGMALLRRRHRLGA